MSSEVPIQLVQWYFMNPTGAQEGPVSSDDLRDLWDAQVVQSFTLVWGASLSEWIPIQKVPTLFEYLHEADEEACDALVGSVRPRGQDDVVETEVPALHPQKLRKTTTETKETTLGESENGEIGTEILKIDEQGGGEKEEKEEKEEKDESSAGVESKPNGSEDPSTRRKGKKRRPKSVLLTEWTEMKVNTNVYITNLPPDVTLEQLAEEFSLCGVIKVNEDGTPRLKIYKDSNGNPKGDGLVSYAREESVHLACQILNGACFRGIPGHKITVTQAVFEMKGNGPFQPKRIQYSKNKKHERLLKWSKDEDLVEKRISPPRTVVLGPMFSAKEMQTSLTLYDEVREDMEMMAKSFGALRNVRVHSNDSKCRVSVHFVDFESARKCCNALKGRRFDGRVLETSLIDGKLRIQQEDHEEVSKVMELDSADAHKEDDGMVEKQRQSLEIAEVNDSANLVNADEEGKDDSERLKDFGEWLEEKDASSGDDSDSD
jgi:RNA recognition motif-containing protein